MMIKERKSVGAQVEDGHRNLILISWRSLLLTETKTAKPCLSVSRQRGDSSSRVGYSSGQQYAVTASHPRPASVDVGFDIAFNARSRLRLVITHDLGGLFAADLVL